MVEVRQTTVFSEWFAGLRDIRAKARIDARIKRLQFGLFGDVKPVGDGVSEFRVDYGPGYRVYFMRRGKEVILLLCGGDKRTQNRDIKAAKAMAGEL
jgi:putative addiction module killer protein